MKCPPGALRFILRPVKTSGARLHAQSHILVDFKNAISLPAHARLRRGEVTVSPPTREDWPELSTETASFWNTQSFKTFVLTLSHSAVP